MFTAFSVPATEARAGSILGRNGGRASEATKSPCEDEKDLRFDTRFGERRSGVNTTQRGPVTTSEGLMVKCQTSAVDQKQEQALKILRSACSSSRRKTAEAIGRKSGMVKGGDARTDRTTIPADRLTDHRVGITLYKLDQVMEGDLDELMNALIAWEQAALLEGGT